MFGHAAGTLKKASFLPLLYAGWQESFCSKIYLTWGFAPSYHVIPSRELTCTQKIGKEIHLPNCLWMEYVSSQGIHPEDAWVVSGCMSHTHPDWNDQIVSPGQRLQWWVQIAGQGIENVGKLWRGTWDTVDGRNPANQFIGSLSHYILLFTGVYTFQVVQDFFYQQYCWGCWWKNFHKLRFPIQTSNQEKYDGIWGNPVCPSELLQNLFASQCFSL